MELWNFRGKQNSITEALQLDIPEHAVISITGAGGKTSLMFAWARELVSGGRRVVVTTSTHIGRPEKMPPHGPHAGISSVYAEPGSDIAEICSQIDKALDEHGLVLVASPDAEKPQKLSAPPSDIMDHIYKSADAVIIEADGARRRPFKWPAPWEPVIPDSTDITVCVAGLAAIGHRPSDIMYRYEDVPEAMQRNIVDEQMLFAVLQSLEGGRKGSRGEFRIFLNQADDEARQSSASRIQQMLAVCGLQSAWGSLDPGADGYGIAVILEAAGNSERFGSNKLLYIMDDGRPMISGILDAAGSLEVYKKIIVTQYEEVAGMASGFDTVINDHPELGISVSMKLGIEAAGRAYAYMFCVCDQPGIKASTLERLIEAYKKGTAGIVSLSWKGKMCNPKIFSSRYRDELMSLSGDTGGRQIIASHADDLLLVEAESEDEVKDIDTRLT